jgi:prepilin-type N-terminal cleavage/methylation domain-containing protein/prepilin-type processing-associated H-X9-DG protein
MKRQKAFTLMELLVVISIIALLLAILVPSLSKARELARRVVCTSNIKSICAANSTYASSLGMYCPIAYQDPAPENPDEKYVPWPYNMTFRKYLQLDEMKDSDDGSSPFDWPDEFLCPSDKISTQKANALDSVLTSYGYNLSDWDDPSWPDGIFGTQINTGHKVESVKQPADKLAFVDAIDWWVSWPGADFERGWDILGQAPNRDYRGDLKKIPEDVWGPTFYRHSEGAVIGFYDGHAERKRKQDIFIKEDWNASPRRAGMWTASGLF